MPAKTRYLSARVLRNEDARLLTGRALFVDDVQLPGMLHVAFVRSDYAHARITSVDVSRRARAPRRGRGLYRRRSGRLLAARHRCWCRRRRFQDLVFHALHAAAAGARTRSATSASRSRWSSPRAATSPKTRFATSSSTSSRSTRSSISRRRSQPARRVSTSSWRRTPPRTCVQRKGDYARRPRQGGRRRHAPLPLRPRRVGGDREPRRRRAVGRAGRRADHLGHHPGADSDPQRPGADARPARIAGARRSRRSSAAASARRS